MDTGSPVRVNTRWHCLFIGRVRPRVHECRTHAPWKQHLFIRIGGAYVLGYEDIRWTVTSRKSSTCRVSPIQGFAWICQFRARLADWLHRFPEIESFREYRTAGALRRSPRLQRQPCRGSRWQKSMLAPAISIILIFTTSATEWHCAGHAGYQKF